MACGLADAAKHETNRAKFMRKTAIDARSLIAERIGKSSFKKTE